MCTTLPPEVYLVIYPVVGGVVDLEKGFRHSSIAGGWNRWRAANPNAKPRLSGSDLSELDLDRANLSDLDLTRSELFGTSLRHANLKMANLSGADLSGAALEGAAIYKAKLSEAYLIEADLARADLSKADLSGADLRGANLREANLTEGKSGGRRPPRSRPHYGTPCECLCRTRQPLPRELCVRSNHRVAVWLRQYHARPLLRHRRP